jgi:hypothetical protein
MRMRVGICISSTVPIHGFPTQAKPMGPTLWRPRRKQRPSMKRQVSRRLILRVASVEMKVTAGNNPVKRQVMRADTLNAVRYDRTHSPDGLETEENTSEEVLELDPG